MLSRSRAMTDLMSELDEEAEDETTVPDSRLAQNATHYAMDHRRRGIAAIFNQEHFQNSEANSRQGSQRDCCSLQRSFSGLGFEVQTFLDLTLAEIRSALETLSQKDHSDCDCFVLVFMSHGLEGKLRSKDDIFDINLLWDRFTAERCPSLANKPKLFFIQACQGHDRQKAVLVSGEEPKDEGSQDAVKIVPSYLLPDRADFLVGLSTIPGFVSWRHIKEGSWYIQTLCRHLDSHGFDHDILTLLTNVSRTVALDFTYRDHFATSSYKKQLPSFTSLLIRILRFTKKMGKEKRSVSRRKSQNGLKRKSGCNESEASHGHSVEKKFRIE